MSPPIHRMYEINETHDPNLRSWVESANDPNTDFPLQNLPFCAFRRKEVLAGEESWLGVVIGDYVLDVGECRNRGLLQAIPLHYYYHSLTPSANLSDYRRSVSGFMRDNTSVDAHAKEQILIPIKDVRFNPSMRINDYTDFYCSIYHATNV